MAIPLIIGGAAIAAGLYGAKKGISGVIDQNNANDMNSDARYIVKSSQEGLEAGRIETNNLLTDYGNRKLRAFHGVIADFVENFNRLKNVELSDSPELERLFMGENSQQVIVGLQKDFQMLQSAGLGLGAGVGSGAALAFGAYNGTMVLASAGTGAAISGLSGVAATNATLAWLGGGTLASGGLGMAGGMAVLGSIVAGPAIAIFGHIVGNKGEEALNNARSNFEQAKTIRTESENALKKLEAIMKVVGLANQTLSSVSTALHHSVHDLKNVLSLVGEDFEKFNPEAKAMVFKAVKSAQLMKAMIDTPILDESGNLVLSTKKRIDEITQSLDNEGGRSITAEQADAEANSADRSTLRAASVLAPTSLGSLVRGKTSSKSPSASQRPVGFGTKLQPSAQLAKIVGSQPIAKTDAIKEMWDYIKANGLQDSSSTSNIHADALLKPIFAGKDQVTMLEMAEFLSQHLS